MLFGKAQFAEAYKPYADDDIEDHQDFHCGNAVRGLFDPVRAALADRVDGIPMTPPECGLQTKAPLPPHGKPGALPGLGRRAMVPTMMMAAKDKVCGFGAGRQDSESDAVGLLTGKKKRWAIGSSVLLCAGLLLAWSLTAAVVVVVHPARRAKVAEVALDVDPDSGKVGSEGLQALFGLAEQGEPLLKVKLGGLGSGGRRLQGGGGGVESLRVELLERVSTVESKPRAGLALLKNWSSRTDPIEAEDPASTTTSPDIMTKKKDTAATTTPSVDVVRVEDPDGALLGHVLCEESGERSLENCTMILEEEQALGALFYNGSGSGSGNTSAKNSSSSGAGARSGGGGLSLRLLQGALAGAGDDGNATTLGGTAAVNISIRNFLRVSSGAWEDGDDAATEVPPNEEEDLEEAADREEEGLSFEVKPGDAVLAHFRTADGGGAKSQEPALAVVLSVEAEAEGEGKKGDQLLALRLELGESDAAGAEPLQTVPKAWVVPLDPAVVGEDDDDGTAAVNGTLGAASPRRACAIGCSRIPKALCWQKDECRSNSWFFVWHLYRAASKTKGQWRFRYNRGETTCSDFMSSYGYGLIQDYGGCGGTGDIQDALQHSMYTAILAAQAGSGKDAQDFMDGRERDPGRSRPSMISTKEYDDQKCGWPEDLHAIMDKHNNEEGRRLAESLTSRACAWNVCVGRWWWRYCYCVWHKTVWPSAERIVDELIARFSNARYITTSTTYTYPDGRLWFLKDSCGSGCGAHGRCQDRHCACDSGWTGSQCSYSRRRRRRRGGWWR